MLDHSTIDIQRCLLSWLSQNCHKPFRYVFTVKCLEQPSQYPYFRATYVNDEVHPYTMDICVLTDDQLNNDFDNPFNSSSYLSIQSELHRLDLCRYLHKLGFDFSFRDMIRIVQSTMPKHVHECNRMLYQLLGPKTYVDIVKQLNHECKLQIAKIHQHLFSSYLHQQGRQYNHAESSNHQIFHDKNGQSYHIFYKSSLYG